MLRMLPCESLTTISPAPASSRPAMTAFTSSAIQRRAAVYSGEVLFTCSEATIPQMPSMSTDTNTLGGFCATAGEARSHDSAHAAIRHLFIGSSASRPPTGSSARRWSCPSPSSRLPRRRPHHGGAGSGTGDVRVARHRDFRLGHDGDILFEQDHPFGFIRWNVSLPMTLTPGRTRINCGPLVWSLSEMSEPIPMTLTLVRDSGTGPSSHP